MKRLLKYFLAALAVITGVFSQTADAKAFSYTYTVSFSAGGQGSIKVVCRYERHQAMRLRFLFLLKETK